MSILQSVLDWQLPASTRHCASALADEDESEAPDAATGTNHIAPPLGRQRRRGKPLSGTRLRSERAACIATGWRTVPAHRTKRYPHRDCSLWSSTCLKWPTATAVPASRTYSRYDPEWKDNLTSITLTGPGGSFTLNGDTDRPMVILRNPQSGQVRGFLRDVPGEAMVASKIAADALSPEPGLEALFSRGIPGAEAWQQ